MKFAEFETAISIPRIGKYLRTCNGDKQKALRLYRYNIKLCQRYYGILSVFEIVLRNAIDNHFKCRLGDPDWLSNQAAKGFLVKYRDTIKAEKQRLVNAGTYSSDRLMSTLSFGVWTYLFTRKCYKNSGKTLLQIFPAKPLGANQDVIYRELDEIRLFRNRIAHHEPLCFDGSGKIDLSYTNRILNLIQNYLTYLGYNPKELLYGIEHPASVLATIKALADSL